jgi:hypothetical protein
VVTGADGQTFTLNAGSAQKSAVATQAVTLGQVLSATVAAVRGAVAYAWYVGPPALQAGEDHLHQLATFSAPLAGTGQTLASSPRRTSRATPTLAFDGLLTTGFVSANNAYFNSLATGTAGTGTVLTASGRGSVVEIDTMLRTMWDTSQVSPTALYVNSQELAEHHHEGADRAGLLGAAAQYFDRTRDPERARSRPAAGSSSTSTRSRWATGEDPRPHPPEHPARDHPRLVRRPAGPVPVEQRPERRRGEDAAGLLPDQLAARTRAQEVGVYAEEVLAVYFPPAIGILTNIANG